MNLNQTTLNRDTQISKASCTLKTLLSASIKGSLRGIPKLLNNTCLNYSAFQTAHMLLPHNKHAIHAFILNTSSF